MIKENYRGRVYRRYQRNRAIHVKKGYHTKFTILIGTRSMVNTVKGKLDVDAGCANPASVFMNHQGRMPENPTGAEKLLMTFGKISFSVT